MPNLEDANQLAAALPLNADPSAAAANPYGLSGQASGEPQGAAISLPLNNDIRADGFGDLIWRNNLSGSNAVWNTPTEANVGAEFIEGLANTAWNLAAAGDFNQDGTSDLLWRNSQTGQNALWLLNSNAEVTERRFIEGLGNRAWEIRAAGDFDNDGILDILWRRNDTGDNAIWFLNSDATVRERSFIEGLSNSSWNIVGAADFTGDSSTDILWRNQETGQNVVWGLNQTNVTQRIFLESLSNPDWQIQGAGDLRGDGSISIFWRNSVTGNNALWNLNGTQVSERVFLPSIANQAWQAVVAARPTTSTVTVTPEPEPEPEPPIPQPEPPAQDNTSGFDITFDYRFDTNGWFTQERRDALEAAADVWESIILDDFEDTPVGTRTPFIRNPQTGEFEGAVRNAGTQFEFTEFTTDVEIDDLLIFVGSQSLGSGILGQGGASGFSPSETRYVGEDFEPWLGSVTFNSDASWFFDATPDTRDDIPFNQNDFISTAIHEIGHVLGFSSGINAFSRHIVNGEFRGPNALQQNGNQGIPLDGGTSQPNLNSHIQDGHEFGGSGETVLDPSSFTGSRQLPTVLDIAILDDIGYDVDYSQASQNDSANGGASSSGNTGLNRLVSVSHDSLAPSRCGCASCHGSAPMIAFTGESSLEDMIAS